MNCDYEIIVSEINIELQTDYNPTLLTAGDMTKVIYDTNHDGIVDTCDFIDGGTF